MRTKIVRQSLLWAFCFLFFWPTVTNAQIVNRSIYARETSLASTCLAILTGPMQITIPACSFTTTGQARVLSQTDSNRDQLEDLLSKNMAEKTSDGRIRVWLQKKDGTVEDRSRTVTLSANVIQTIVPLAADTYYRAALGIEAGMANILWQSSTDQRTWLPTPPASWSLIHILIFPFLVPAGDTSLFNNRIEVFTVLLGFPPGSVPEDFKRQIGN